LFVLLSSYATSIGKSDTDLNNKNQAMKNEQSRDRGKIEQKPQNKDK